MTVTEQPPLCWRCNDGTRMVPAGVPGVFLCRCAAAIDNGRKLGCDCGFCREHSNLYRINALLNETGLGARGAKMPEEFIHGPPGGGGGI